MEQGHEVFGFDNINDTYEVNLKYARLQELGLDRNLIDASKYVKSNSYTKLTFAKLALENRSAMEKLFKTEQFDLVCHLAAQAGVRYSIENPHSYAESNLVGFLNILRAVVKTR